MATSTSWIGEFLQEREVGRKGNLALLREAADHGLAKEIGGGIISPDIARVMMHVYERLTGHDQELFAVNCNLDFAGWVLHCLKSLAAMVGVPALKVSGVTVTNSAGVPVVALVIGTPDGGHASHG